MRFNYEVIQEKSQTAKNGVFHAPFQYAWKFKPLEKIL